MTNNEFGTEKAEEQIHLSELGKSAIMQTLYFGIGFLTASSSREKFFSPLGIAFACGVDRQHTLFSCFGAMAGYIISNDYINAFRYVMALILVYILKVYASTFPRLERKVVIPAFISLFATLSTGIVVMATEPIDLNSIFTRFAEATVSFGGAYLFSASIHSAEKLKTEERITEKEMISLLVSALALILCFREISLLGITVSGVVCSYIVMIAAYIFRESGGTVTGTGVSLGFALTGNSLPVVFCYAGAGLFSGIFSYSGRVLCACAYIFSHGALYVLLGDTDSITPLLEAALASVFFVITPGSLIFKIKVKLSSLSYTEDDSELRNMLISQLQSVRDAICDMSSTVTRVTKALNEKDTTDTAAIYLKVRAEVCEKCASFNRCWKTKLSETIDELDEVAETVRTKGGIAASAAPLSLQSKCIRIMSLCDSFNKNYALHSARIGAKGRIDEMRKITADQFDTIGEMLDDLLVSFKNGAKPLAGKSLALKNSLEDIGVSAFVSCYEDEDMNMIINMSVENTCRISNGEIRDCIIKSTEREFSYPAVINGENEKIMLFWEKTPLSADCVYHQLSSEEGKVCGDCFDSFFDGKGNFIAILSDGMGTGERAAVDGAMASSLFSRLIISGFSFSCALRLVNSAMLVKSCDESLATLDILKVNLYNGQAVIYKAGATVSLLCRKGKINEIKRAAMPIGILRQAEFATVKGGLKNDDVIVMMSDGAADNSLDDIKRYITEKGFSYDLPERLCRIARSKNKSHSDDITVAVIKIKMNDD